jgi:hypothetical protein
MAFNMFRLAGILQGIMARALQGNASSQEAIETGKRARPLAEEAWRQVEAIIAGQYDGADPAAPLFHEPQPQGNISTRGHGFRTLAQGQGAAAGQPLAADARPWSG